MTDVEQAREALVRRGYPLGGVTAWENLIRAVFAEMRAAEVPEPQSVAEPVKRMMLANTKPGFNHGYHSVFHEWHESCKYAGCDVYH